MKNYTIGELDLGDGKSDISLMSNIFGSIFVIEVLVFH